MSLFGSASSRRTNDVVRVRRGTGEKAARRERAIAVLRTSILRGYVNLEVL